MWFPCWLSSQEFTFQCRRCTFDPWVRKILWRRKWQLTPVFLPGKFYGQRSLAGCNPWGCRELNPQHPSPIRGTMGSSLRSLAEVQPSSPLRTVLRKSLSFPGCPGLDILGKELHREPCGMRQASERPTAGPGEGDPAAHLPPLAPPGRWPRRSSGGHGGDSSTKAEITGLHFLTEKTK